MITMAIRTCYDSYMHHVLFTYFTVLIVQDFLDHQPLAEGTRQKIVRNNYGIEDRCAPVDWQSTIDKCNNIYIKRAAKQSVETTS